MNKTLPQRIEENEEYPLTINRYIRKINDYFENRTGACPVCGIFFERKRKDQEYCSGKCKDTALKRRKRRSVERNQQQDTGYSELFQRLTRTDNGGHNE